MKGERSQARIPQHTPKIHLGVLISRTVEHNYSPPRFWAKKSNNATTFNEKNQPCRIPLTFFFSLTLFKQVSQIAIKSLTQGVCVMFIRYWVIPRRSFDKT